MVMRLSFLGVFGEALHDLLSPTLKLSKEIVSGGSLIG